MARLNVDDSIKASFSFYIEKVTNLQKAVEKLKERESQG